MQHHSYYDFVYTFMLPSLGNFCDALSKRPSKMEVHHRDIRSCQKRIYQLPPAPPLRNYNDNQKSLRMGTTRPTRPYGDPTKYKATHILPIKQRNRVRTFVLYSMWKLDKNIDSLLLTSMNSMTDLTLNPISQWYCLTRSILDFNALLHSCSFCRHNIWCKSTKYQVRKLGKSP